MSTRHAGVQEVKFLTLEQEKEAKHFKDPATNQDLNVTDKVRAPARAAWCGGRGGQAVRCAA